MPKVIRHKLDRSSSTAITPAVVSDTETTYQIFELMSKGRSIQSVQKELGLTKDRIYTLVRTELRQMTAASHDMADQYRQQTLMQVNYLIEYGLKLLEMASPENPLGLWKTIASTYLELAKYRATLFGVPLSPEQQQNVNNGTVNVLNVGNLTRTFPNTPNEPLMKQAEEDPDFFVTAFQDRYGTQIREYAEDHLGIVIENEDLTPIHDAITSATPLSSIFETEEEEED